MTLRDNREFHRFEAEIDGHTAVLKYMRKGSVIHLVHTDVPVEIQGRGTGTALARYALDSARAEGAKVKVVCTTVRRFIDRNPQYAELEVE